MRCYPLDDTDYTAADEGAYLCTRTRGVFSTDDNLRVSPAGGMNITVSKGIAWHKISEFWGVAAVLETNITLTADPADGTYPRIDAAIERVNKISNKSEIILKKGTPAPAPSAPAPTVDSSYDELVLAHVRIERGAISITSANIDDKRTDEALCGIMRDGVTGIPTAQFQEQADELITALRTEIAAIQQGSEVMLKTVYDADGDGKVDSAAFADAAAKLKTARKINGVNFDGTSDITVADDTKLPLTGGNITGKIKVADEIQTTASNSFRQVSAGFGSFWRNDGANLYLMITDRNDPYGGYNSLRPLVINFDTGKADISGNAATATKAATSDYATSAGNSGFAQNCDTASMSKKLTYYKFGAAPDLTDEYRRFYVKNIVTTNTMLIPIAGKHGGSMLPYQFSFDEPDYIRAYPIGHTYKADYIYCILA